MSETTLPPGGAQAGESFDAQSVRTSSLYNEDLAPVPVERRIWGTYNYAALWIAMSVNIPTYLLASSMIAGGMSWKQAIFTVFLGNVLVLIPMLLNAHAGAEYGIPFPVFARSAFGVLGANVPAMLRALVACGWFGIQTWIGGEAIYAMIVALDPALKDVRWGVPVCFACFWLLNLIVIVRGIQTIRFLQGITAPFLLLIGLALLLWARAKAGGFGPMLATPSKFQTFGEFFRFFVPSLTGVVAFWATVALNIPDFTRYARGQREQMLGQALGLPTTMTFYSFIGIAVTSATVVLVWPGDLGPGRGAFAARQSAGGRCGDGRAADGHAERQRRRKRGLARERFFESVAAAHQFPHRWNSHLPDRRGHAALEAAGELWELRFRMAGRLLGISGPGRRDPDLRLFRAAKENTHPGRPLSAGWRVRILKRRKLEGDSALVAGSAVAFVGLVYAPVRVLYDYAWFVGFGVSFVAYWALTAVSLVAARKRQRQRRRSTAALDRSSSGAARRRQSAPW